MKGNFFFNGILSFSGGIISELENGYLADIKGRIWLMKYSAYLCSISLLIYKFVGTNLSSIFVIGSMFGYAEIYIVLEYIFQRIFLYISGEM